MRARLTCLIVTLLLSAAAIRASDAIAWIRADGAPGWSTSIGEIPRDAAATSPLSAPIWFARFPDAKIPLAPTGAFDPASARGKVVLLDFWASWCAPCLRELPHLQKLHVARVGDGLLTVAVNADEPAEVAAESAKRLGLTMPIGVNEPAVYRALGVRTLPTLFAIDKSGRLRKRWDGYRPNLEREIAQTVDKLLADDTAGTTREVARVIGSSGRLQARWSRDLVGAADGVVGLPAGSAGTMRVIASGGGELVSFDAEGEALARLDVDSGAGRLRDFGAAADGTRELLAYRTGATSVRVIALRSGSLRTIALPAPLLDLAITGPATGDGRRLAFATMAGAAQADARDARAILREGASSVRSVAAQPPGSLLALREGGAIGPWDGASPAFKLPAAVGSRLLASGAGGALVGPQTVIAVVSGRFLPDGARQFAVATYDGHLTLLDESSGRVVFDSAWSGIHDLSAVDLDGDGHEELLVAAGRSITALGAPGR